MSNEKNQNDSVSKNYQKDIAINRSNFKSSIDGYYMH
jgi:hypothetical protein